MQNLADTSALYDSLRALGPISADEVPDTIARQFGDKSVEPAKVKQAIAVYAKLANQGTLEEFNAAVEKGGLAYAMSNSEGTLEVAAKKSCCGHTWEGTCTPASPSSL